MAGTPAGAVTAQFTLFDATGTNTTSSYYQPAFSSPANWTTPINYSAGTAYWRLQVVSKPSSLPIQAQFCMWRQNFTVETCSGLSPTITDEGTYWINLGRPQNWWKKNGNWAMTAPQNVRIMLKDKASGKLLLYKSCGAYCYPRSDLASHDPITLNSQLIIVAAGATLAPPAKFAGCPGSWSPACTTGGTTGTTAKTTTTIGGGGTGVTVSIADAKVVEPDSGSVSLPFKVTLSRASSSTVKVNVTASPGTATAGSDFGTRGGPIAVSIAPGHTYAWVGFPVYGNTVREANETVFANLSSPIGATIGDGHAVGTIVNDD